MHKIAIIEDEKDIAELIKIHLEQIDCETILFSNGSDAYKYLTLNDVSALVLDVNLPGMNGMEICKRMRSRGMMTPILMLTARSEEGDKVMGLEIGADDYMTKPFSVRELTARMKAILRRIDHHHPNEEGKPVIVYKGLEIDFLIRRASLDGERIELTPKEFELLYLLASNPGVTFERGELLNKVWGYDFEGYEHTVNSHINRLRAKIEKDPANPDYVLTTWGVGYRFADAKPD